MITLYGRKTAFNVQKVAWLLRELDPPHRHIEVGGEFGGLDEPDFRAMNPHGKIPVLDDDGTILWESQAILRYLAARYGAPGFWSDDAIQRARVDQWMDWSQTTFSRDFLIGVFWGWYRTPPDLQDTDAIEAALGRVSASVQKLEALIGNQSYLLGETLSLADIAVGVNFFRYYEIDIQRLDAPRIAAWYGRLTERAPYQEAVMIPFDYMKGRLDF